MEFYGAVLLKVSWLLIRSVLWATPDAYTLTFSQLWQLARSCFFLVPALFEYIVIALRITLDATLQVFTWLMSGIAPGRAGLTVIGHFVLSWTILALGVLVLRLLVVGTSAPAQGAEERVLRFAIGALRDDQDSGEGASSEDETDALPGTNSAAQDASS